MSYFTFPFWDNSRFLLSVCATNETERDLISLLFYLCSPLKGSAGKSEETTAQPAEGGESTKQGEKGEEPFWAARSAIDGTQVIVV